MGPREGVPASVRSSGLYIHRFESGYTQEELVRIFAKGSEFLRGGAEPVQEVKPRRRLRGKQGRPAAPRPPAVPQRCSVTNLAPTWPTLAASSAQRRPRLQRLQKLWWPRQQSLVGQVVLPPGRASGGGHTSRTNSGLQTL